MIANGKLFIVLQRLDSDNGWIPSKTPYLAVFDVEINEEIDTGMGSEGLKGIPLLVQRPLQHLFFGGQQHDLRAGSRFLAGIWRSL